MDPARRSQYPMDMGENGECEISRLFQCITRNTMNMGSISRQISTTVPALSNTQPRKVLP
jgi:hypothetical protein